MRPFSFQSFVLTSLVIFLAPLALRAQDATGTVAGVITDPTGAVVQQAKVTVTNVGTKISKQITTNTSGFYQVQHLPIGNYQVSVETAGFAKPTPLPLPSTSIRLCASI